MEIATQCYRDFRPEFGVPVRITRGNPRFKLGYEIRERVMALAPSRDIFKAGLSPEEFDEAYREEIEAVGLAAINSKLQEISQRNGHKRLVLLCFEKVLDGEFCHRRVFARWWYEQTGVAVPELAINVNTAEVMGYSDASMPVPHHRRGIIGPIKSEVLF